jgi:hypothetical protein
VSRASFFHEKLVTAFFGGFLTWNGEKARKGKSREGRAKALTDDSAEEGEATEVSEARSQWAPWGEKTHARELPHREARENSRGKAACVQLRSAEAVMSAVKHSVPR